MDYKLLKTKLKLSYPSKRGDGINYVELGAAVGFTHAGISRTLRLENLTLDLYERICNALKVPAGYFFNDADISLNKNYVSEPETKYIAKNDELKDKLLHAYETITEKDKKIQQLQEELKQSKKSYPIIKLAKVLHEVFHCSTAAGRIDRILLMWVFSVWVQLPSSLLKNPRLSRVLSF